MTKRESDQILLDGEWRIIFDNDNRGKISRLYQKEVFNRHKGIKKIQVPSCWETTRMDYEGVAWYGYTLAWGSQYKNKCIRLHFGAVNYLSELWVNGIPVGYHEGGYTDFEFEIQDFLQENQDNFICLRVVSPLISEDKTIGNLSSNEMPNWRGALSAGIWQSVQLIISDPIYIDTIFVEPVVAESKAVVHVEIHNTTYNESQVVISFSINELDNKQELEVLLQPGCSTFDISIPIENLILWELDNPYLYWVTVQVVDMQLSFYDSVSQRFGMREFTFNHDKFYLNGREIMVKAAFYEGLYPHTLSYPQSADFIKKEMALSKEANLNMLRPWRKPQPPIVYDIADEMGVLFVGAMAVECMNFYPLSSPYMEERIKREFSSMVKRDRNHPSIVIWEAFNEIHRLELSRLKHKVSLIGRELDPTRIIFDESGGFSGVPNLYPPYKRTPVRINDVHAYPGAPFANKDYDTFVHLVENTNTEATENMEILSSIEPNLLTNVSELGYGSFANLESNYTEYIKHGNPITPDFRYHQRLYLSLKKVLQDNVQELYSDVDTYCAASQYIHYQGNKYMMEACRLNKHVAGLMVHAFSDGDWIVGAGLVDIFRNPKQSYYAVKEVFNEVYMAIRTDKPNYFQHEKVSICRHVVSDKVQGQVAVETNIQDQNGVAIFSHNEELNVSKEILPLDSISLDNMPTGPMQVECKVIKNGTCITQNTYDFFMLPTCDWNLVEGEFCCIDSQNKLTEFLTEKHIKTAQFADTISYNIPVIICSIDEKQDTALISRINNWAKNGGTVIWLTLPTCTEYQGDETVRFKLADTSLVPFHVKYCNAKGLWEPKNHIVKDTQLFAGLPNGMMDNVWQNVVSHYSFVDFDGENVAPMISYDWFQGKDLQKNYKGPSAVYCGSDFFIKKHGKGTYMMSTLRLVSATPVDSFGEKIFYNLLKDWNLFM